MKKYLMYFQKEKGGKALVQFGACFRKNDAVRRAANYMLDAQSEDLKAGYVLQDDGQELPPLRLPAKQVTIPTALEIAAIMSEAVEIGG